MALFLTILVIVMGAIGESNASVTEQESNELRTALVVNQLLLQQQSELLRESCRVDEGNQQDQIIEILKESLKVIIEDNQAFISKLEMPCPYVEGNIQEELGEVKERLQVIEGNQQTLQERERPCPYPYRRVLDMCIFLSETTHNWNAAQDYCSNMGGHLAMPRYPIGLQYYIKKQNTGNDGYWLGGTEPSHGEWTYLDGSSIPQASWWQRQPDGWGSGSQCLAMYAPHNPPLEDFFCTGNKIAVCQYE